MTIGENVKKIRKEKGLTQKELGERLGITQSAIGQFENDKTSPTITTISKIANALDVEIDKIMNIPMQYTYEHTYLNQERIKIPDINYIKKREQLLSNFNKLNDLGQNKILEDIEDLTALPKYQKEKEDPSGDS